MCISSSLCCLVCQVEGWLEGATASVPCLILLSPVSPVLGQEEASKWERVRGAEVSTRICSGADHGGPVLTGLRVLAFAGLPAPSQLLHWSPCCRLGRMVLAIFTSLQGAVSILQTKGPVQRGPGLIGASPADQVLKPRAV